MDQVNAQAIQAKSVHTHSIQIIENSGMNNQVSCEPGFYSTRSSLSGIAGSPFLYCRLQTTQLV